MKINVKLNGINRVFDVAADEYLVDTLRNNNILSVKRGCETSSCGACTVLVDFKPFPSCATLSMRMDGKEITTVEGVYDEVDKLADFFGKQGADQCGFCNPSLALATIALKKEYKNPSDDTIREYLVGNLCRCTGYEAQHKAIKEYLEVE